MKGGAWPFFVGDLTCQVDFDNERDYRLLILKLLVCLFLNCTIVDMMWKDDYDNRSVMLLDVMGCEHIVLNTSLSLVNLRIMKQNLFFLN